MFKIAAIILSYRNSRETLNCVASILNGSYSDIDIFVVDNHSPDGAYQILQKELPHSPNLFLFETGANLGYAGGMNFGARQAAANGAYAYYLFLNNDTVLDKDCLAQLVKVALSLGKGNVYAPISFFSNTTIVFCGGMESYIPGLFQFKYMGLPFLPHKDPYPSPYLSGACFMVPVGLFRKIGGFDEALYLYGEDVLFGEHARWLGGQIYMVPSARFWHIGSKAAGYLTVTKAYYLARNIPQLVRLISNNHLVYLLRTYIYLFTKALLALFTFNPQAVRAIFRGLQDFRDGVGGPFVAERGTRNQIQNSQSG
jgi:GT2 family glycosyltransferase